MTILSCFLLAACGGPKADITVFIMPSQGTAVPEQMSTDLNKQLQQKMGAEKTVDLVTSPMYNIQKLIAEYAVASNGIIILPEQDLKGMAGQGGAMPLEDTFDQDTFKKGVFEAKVLVPDASGKEIEKTETHLYALPLNEMKLFKAVGYAPDDMYAIIPYNAPDRDLSFQTMKMLTE